MQLSFCSLSETLLVSALMFDKCLRPIFARVSLSISRGMENTWELSAGVKHRRMWPFFPNKIHIVLCSFIRSVIPATRG